jgi:hypothetical protein
MWVKSQNPGYDVQQEEIDRTAICNKYVYFHMDVHQNLKILESDMQQKTVKPISKYRQK